MNYTAEQIRTLQGLEAIQQMPGMYVGSVTSDGLHHILKEVISNSIDEYINGAGTHITVIIKKDGSVTVSDNARGVPIGIHESGCSTLQAVFGILNTGGKYDKDGKNGYNTSGGQHGVGAKATNALSEFLIASTVREGKKQTVYFEKGAFIKEEMVAVDASNGTTVTFKPDPKVFETVDYDYKRVCGLCEELSYLCKGLTIAVADFRGSDIVKSVFKSDHGLIDYIAKLNSGKQTITEPMFINAIEGKTGVEIAMQYNTGYSDSVKLFTNMIPNTEGTHLTGFRTALTRTINSYARDKKLLKEKDENLTGEDLKEGQTLVINLKMLKPIFEGQHKEKLTSTEGRTLTEQLASKEIRTWLEENPESAKAIVSKALISKKAREAAKRARETARKKATSVLGSVLPGKLTDCSSANPDESEIYIVEGDSAAGTAKDARNRQFQAILPLRGKVLNVLKTDLSKAMNNAEIKAMIHAFGLELVGGTKIVVNKDKLRYGKIIIMTDGDVDGSHIRILLLTFIWTYAKELITDGYVYAAVPPLYKVTKGKENYYLLNDAALDKFKKENRGNITVQRFKGLGEMNAEQLEETTMSMESRVLKQITVNDMAKANLVIQNLMGDQVAPRRDFIEANSHKAKIDL